MSADRRRGWARGGVPRTAFPRAPPPEDKSAAGRREEPRRSSRGPLCLPKAGTGPRGLPREFRPRQRRARPDLEEGREASSTRVKPWIPTTKCVGMTAARCPAPCAGRGPAASAAGPWPKPGRCPEWRNAPRGGGSDGAWKERGHRVSRATRSGARISVAARQRRAKGEGKAAARGASSGAVAPRLRGAKGGRAMGA